MTMLHAAATASGGPLHIALPSTSWDTTFTAAVKVTDGTILMLQVTDAGGTPRLSCTSNPHVPSYVTMAVSGLLSPGEYTLNVNAVGGGSATVQNMTAIAAAITPACGPCGLMPSRDVGVALSGTLPVLPFTLLTTNDVWAVQIIADAVVAARTPATLTVFDTTLETTVAAPAVGGLTLALAGVLPASTVPYQVRVSGSAVSPVNVTVLAVPVVRVWVPRAMTALAFATQTNLPYEAVTLTGSRPWAIQANAVLTYSFDDTDLPVQVSFTLYDVAGRIVLYATSYVTEPDGPYPVIKNLTLPLAGVVGSGVYYLVVGAFPLDFIVSVKTLLAIAV
jgi:hypothetical protein